MSPASATSRKAVFSLAEADITRRSHAKAQPRPAPAQAPFIAATVTAGISCSNAAMEKGSAETGSSASVLAK